MQVPFKDLGRHYRSIQTDIDRTIARVLASGCYVMGRELERFEMEFADYLGVGHAIGVGSGTEALHLSLIAAGVSSGDEVITAANAGISTLSAIFFAGAKPVLVDIDPACFCMDITQTVNRISARTAAIIPVHLHGHTCAMDDLRVLAEKNGLSLIEDARQAHGAAYKGRKTGTLGAFGCFSFYPTRNLGAFGDGGMVVTRDTQRAERLKLLRNHGLNEHAENQGSGFTSRLDEMQAALLSVQLPYLETWNVRRRQIAAIYEHEIKNPRVKLPAQRAEVYHVYNHYAIRCPERERLRQHLKEYGVGTQIHYPLPCHLQKSCQELGYSRGSFPVSELYAAQTLSLPMYPELSNDEVRFVAEVINRFE